MNFSYKELSIIEEALNLRCRNIERKFNCRGGECKHCNIYKITDKISKERGIRSQKIFMNFHNDIFGCLP